MQTRFGIALSLCLVAAVASTNGCGSPDEGQDAGTPDAGQQNPPDAGQPKPDAGTPPPQGDAIGDECTPGSGNDIQGSCEDDFACTGWEFEVFGLNGKPTTRCTARCKSDDQCGENGILANVCTVNGIPQSDVPIFTNGDGMCLRACMVDDDCASGQVCVGLVFGQVCIPDCSLAENECAYGTTCDTLCRPTFCDEATGNCATQGDICVFRDETDPEEEPGVCVGNCATAGCPRGYECDNASGVCEVPGGEYYQLCNNSTPCPEEDAICVVTKQDGSGVCLQDCTESGLCGGTPENQVCGLELTNGSNTCVALCRVNGDCPTGTTCQNGGCLR